MYLLSLETTSQTASVAVLEDNSVLLEHTWISRDPGRELVSIVSLAFTRTGIAPENIDRVVVSTGPGSWTGIRLSMGFALGIARSDAQRIYGVSSLEGLAFQLGEARKMGAVVPGTGQVLCCCRFADRASLIRKPEPLFRGKISEARAHMRTCGIIARSGMMETTPRLAGRNAYEIPLFPRASANGGLAYARILLNIKPENMPDYEK